MKLTTKQLKQIIKEELQSVLESDDPFDQWVAQKKASEMRRGKIEPRLKRKMDRAMRGQTEEETPERFVRKWKDRILQMNNPKEWEDARYMYYEPLARGETPTVVPPDSGNAPRGFEPQSHSFPSRRRATRRGLPKHKSDNVVDYDAMQMEYPQFTPDEWEDVISQLNTFVGGLRGNNEF
jgi:hypothetical protein